MLVRTSALCAAPSQKRRAQCAYNRHVLTEVQSVLDEMVYDVESCEHECELVTLRQQLATAESSLLEYQERESELIQERQQAYEYAVKVEQEGRTIMSKLNEHLSVVVSELAKKEVMEKELQQAKEHLKLTGQLSKELASAQREIHNVMLKLFSFLDEDSMVAISVTDKVLAHLAQVQTEKEDVAARLYSAESVRDFLMEKLKDLEDTLANSMTATAKNDAQAAVDREIIGFLDAKTQEYEVALKEYALQNNGLRMELAQLIEDHASKTTIIQDMVELLTEEKKELEGQVPFQRKILVREVKVLRAQNQQLAAEKDHYFTQLKQLKHALQHLEELSNQAS
ncbi:hypothetical protein PInf_026617 [Phytophthora infestans]|nr:hypothetical protein PInf_026617 [Phytophthora infestans]